MNLQLVTMEGNTFACVTKTVSAHLDASLFGAILGVDTFGGWRQALANWKRTEI